MKAKDAMRAARLVEAREIIPQLIDAFKRKDDAAQHGYDYRGARFVVGDLSRGDEGEFHNPKGWVDLDIDTARMLVPLLRDLIDEELRSLGVEL